MEMKKSQRNYFVGLDIGTDSIGYAVADTSYALCNFHGEPMWGVTLFDEAMGSEDRRGFRTARRRLDRRQQRVSLLTDLFAREIAKIDPKFFIRLKESSLIAEDTTHGESFSLFGDKEHDKAYHKTYPTIHHLLVTLMQDETPHDVREVYLACQWLVAHRGHFLSEVGKDSIQEVTEFDKVYADFAEAVKNMTEDAFLPWDETLGREVLAKLLIGKGVTKKLNAIKEQLFGGKFLKEIGQEEKNGPYFYHCELIFKLLCGTSGVELAKLFGNEAYKELEVAKVSLDMEDDVLAGILANLEEQDAELLRAMKAVYDWSVLIDALKGKASISEGKVADYDQHQADLAYLKWFVKKYMPQEFDNIFRNAVKDNNNYVSYTYNVKSCANPESVKKCSIEVFAEFLRKKLKDIPVEEADREAYEDMMTRLEKENLTFMPKQKNTNNRVIPYQLYWYELNEILKRASGYLPFLNEADDYGTVAEKILSIFEFRIPYYVGPLRNDKNDKRKHAWVVRKAGKIYPWNFDAMVDLDASENEFIRKMTNVCTYIPGADVLPKASLCYSAFMVLNAINNIKINDQPISVEVKQKLFLDYCMEKPRLTKKGICDYLISQGDMTRGDELTGIDVNIGASLQSFKHFRRIIHEGILTTEQVEAIIERATFAEDKRRFGDWLRREYPHISEADIKHILAFKCNDFGRLSKAFLCGCDAKNPDFAFVGVEKKGTTGESFSIMEMLWSTNYNLMQLLSDDFTFMSQVNDIRQSYYAEHSLSLSDRLDEMYIPNAVKRPIIRTMDILRDVVKVMGHDPERIFVEMARGATEEQKKKRTSSRLAQVRELYAKLKNEEIRQLQQRLDDMGDMAENRLQSDKIFLYFLQLGKCMYTGETIDFNSLLAGAGVYNIEHIYPQSLVKDDSIVKNKVLVLSTVNGQKSDDYPISPDIQSKMRSFWDYLHTNGLISDEKYQRLIRTTHFTDEEKYAFIDRQMVETRQSTKAVATLLKERYPDTEIVYVKAGLVSEFRQEFDLLKSREYNDLHHAKDAYLNIVVGNVYHCRFSRQWFFLEGDKKYNVKVGELFAHAVYCRGEMVWRGQDSLDVVFRMMRKPYVHMTTYAVCKKSGQSGGFFNQQPKKKAEGLIPLKSSKKKGEESPQIDTSVYGGYNGATISFFVLTRYTVQEKKKEIRDVMFVPVELLYVKEFLADCDFADRYVQEQIEKIQNVKVTNVEILLNRRIIKTKTIFSLDGLRVILNGSSTYGKKIDITTFCPFTSNLTLECISAQMYIEYMEKFMSKKRETVLLEADERYDGITVKRNLALFELLVKNFPNSPYYENVKNPYATLKQSRNHFSAKGMTDQVVALMFILNSLDWHSIANEIVSVETVETYIKKIDIFKKKKDKMPNIQADARFDGITSEKNMVLYDLYIEKLHTPPYCYRPANPYKTLVEGREKFMQMSASEQTKILLEIHGLFNRKPSANLKPIGGAPEAGVTTLSSKLSNWAYKKAYIIDTSASGLFEQVSENLLDLL